MAYERGQLFPATRHRVPRGRQGERLDDAADLDGQARAQQRDAQDPDSLFVGATPVDDVFCKISRNVARE